MNTHTPGPWKAHKTGLARSGKPEFEIHWSDIGECVAEIVHGEADAALIAAAPELLAGMARGRRKLATYVSVYPGDKELIGLLAEWDSAIAKATGEPA